MDARAIVAACAVALATAVPAPAQAAIAFHDKSTGNTGLNPALQLTVPAPTGLAVDDVMLATIAIRVQSNAISAPGGWTLVPGLDNNDTGVRTATFFKVADSGDLGASYIFSIGSTFVSRGAGGIVAYSGVDTGTPIDLPLGVGAATSNGTASTTATAPSVTTTNLRSRVVVATGWGGGVTLTPAGTTTERYVSSSTNGTASNNEMAEASDFTQATPGPTGATSVGASLAKNWVAQTIALNEQPELTASFPSAYAWPALAPGTTATSAEQTVSVTSNRSWGLEIASDRADGRSRQWTGSAYGSLALTDPMQWRTTSIGGTPQASSFANLTGTGTKAVTGQAASAGAIAVGVTYRQQVSYADEAALPAGNTYRQNVSYTAQQGF